MALREELEQTGNWLFKRRSYLPLLLIGILVMGMRESGFAGGTSAWNSLWEVICLLVSLVGLAVRVYTVGGVPGGTSGRSTRCPEAKVLNTSGIYSVVRHPLYLGNCIIWLGVSMIPFVWWTTLLFVLIFWCYYERIMIAEEAFLREKFGSEFEDWAEKTPAFIPGFRNWRPSVLSFSVRNALKREYSGFMAIIMSFTFLELLGGLFAEGRLRLDGMWRVLFCVGVIVYVTLRFLKRKTRILSVEGR